MRLGSATSGLLVCCREELRSVVVTSQLQPGGIPSGERERRVTIRIQNQIFRVRM